MKITTVGIDLAKNVFQAEALSKMSPPLLAKSSPWDLTDA
jgi:hypothetical protein